MAKKRKVRPKSNPTNATVPTTSVEQDPYERISAHEWRSGHDMEKLTRVFIKLKDRIMKLDVGHIQAVSRLLTKIHGKFVCLDGSAFLLIYLTFCHPIHQQQIYDLVARLEQAEGGASWAK